MDNASEHMTTHVEAPLLTSPLRSSTPLLQAPSALLPWTIDDNRGALAQSSYGRPPSAPPFFAQSYTQAQSQSITRLARIESELDRARNDVKTKDQAIDSLRGQLVTLQVAVQARTKRENDSNNEEKVRLRQANRPSLNIHQTSIYHDLPLFGFNEFCWLSLGSDT